jgi:hypothetical protein
MRSASGGVLSPSPNECDAHVLQYNEVSGRTRLDRLSASWQARFCDGYTVVSRLVAYTDGEPDAKITEYKVIKLGRYSTQWNAVLDALQAGEIRGYYRDGREKRPNEWQHARVRDLASVTFEQRPIIQWIESRVTDKNLKSVRLSDEQAKDLIRAELHKNDGFLSQNDGAKIVRKRDPNFPRDRARKLVAELTRNTKPGPRGPRNHSSK